MIKERLAAEVCGLNKNASTRPQGGSMLLEAVIVLGMIATFTPLLYKQVADRRADIENINRANTLLYLQQKTEKYLKDPANIKALVDELGHNQHKEIYPSEMGIGDNFDGRYIIGIRREDEENKPVLKAMIIDAVNTGSDTRAAKVAELIGVSAGIYTAVDPNAAWGINGLWSEPLERYFTTKNFPTGAVAVTTEYNKEKYRVNISDILVDSDLDLGEFDLTAEQINAINIAAQNGTIDQLIAKDITSQNVTATTKVASPKVVASEKLCVGGEKDKDCIESWEGLGEDGQKTDLQLVQECNSGMTYSCMKAFDKGLNRTCAEVDAVYDAFNDTYPSPKIYTLAYGNGSDYAGKIRAKCEGTSFVVDSFSTQNLSSAVETVGDSAFVITQPGWYQIALLGEPGSSTAENSKGAGGILIANKEFSRDDILTLKAIKGGKLPDIANFGGAGIALFDSVYTNRAPSLVAGGGSSAGYAGGGYEGGYGSESQGYSWNGELGANMNYCNAKTNCNVASGGAELSGSSDYGGTGYCKSEYTCTIIPGGNSTASAQSWSAAVYGSRANGYASISYCGSSEASCPKTCTADSNCSGSTPYCDNGFCSAKKSCTVDAACSGATPFCDKGFCSATKSCASDSDCPSSARYCSANICSPLQAGTRVLSGTGSYKTVAPGRYQIVLYGEQARGYWNSSGCIDYDEFYAGGGILTAYKQLPKGVTLTVKVVAGGVKSYCCSPCYSYRGGSGVVFFAGSSAPVLAAGGGAGCDEGGGGYAGGSGATVSGYNWTGTTGSSGISYSGGKSMAGGGSKSCGSGRSARSSGGGSGFCENSYVCVSGGTNDRNNSVAHGNVYATVTYCGPTSSSPCP